MSLPDQEVYSRGNRKRSTVGVQMMDAESHAALEGLAPEVEGRFINAVELEGLGLEDALALAQRNALIEQRPWAAIITSNPVDTNYIRDYTKRSEWRTAIRVARGRAKMIGAVDRSNVGSMVVVFWPECGVYTMTLED